MKKFISIFLAISLMLCIFAGCSKKDASDDESTTPAIEEPTETRDDTESTSAETESDPTETETETKTTTETTTEKSTTSAEPTVQLQKTYYGHSLSSDGCCETFLYFKSNGDLEIVIDYSITEAPEYEGIEEESHEHNGVKYYLFDGTGYISGYQLSGNKITTDGEGTFTIISNSSIKRSDGVVFNIISDNNRFEA